jgi:hypothetical protein
MWKLSVRAFAVGRRMRAWWRFRASLGNGLSEVDAFYNPRRRHAIELRTQDILKREEG